MDLRFIEQRSSEVQQRLHWISRIQRQSISEGKLHYGQPNLRRRCYSKETIYESIRTTGEKKKGRLLDKVLKRNFNAQKTVLRQVSEMSFSSTYDNPDFPMEEKKIPDMSQISEAEIKEAYGLI